MQPAMLAAALRCARARGVVAAAPRALLPLSALRGCTSSALRYSADGVLACSSKGADEFAVFVAPRALAALGGVAFADLPDAETQLLLGERCRGERERCGD